MALIGVPWEKSDQDVDDGCLEASSTFLQFEIHLCVSPVIVLYLRYEVSSQCSVFTGHFGESRRNNISHPLKLMNDSVRVRHVGSVSHVGLTILSDHSVYLCLDFL